MTARNPVAYAAGQAIRQEIASVIEQHHAQHPFERLPVKRLQARLSRPLSARQIIRHLQALRTQRATA